jgi:hypothetical protein
LANEEQDPEMVFQEFHMAADGTTRDVQFFRGADEAAMPGGCLEGSESVQGGKSHASPKDQFS